MTVYWTFGLDLGQRRDHSAIAALNLTWIPQGQCKVTYEWLFQPLLTLRCLERFPLGMSYEDLITVVAEKLRTIDQRLMTSPMATQPKKELIIDAGGPGIPFIERLRRTVSRGIRITPVMITGGKTANALEGGFTGIPRRALIAQLLFVMSVKSLRAPLNLPGWEIFEEELLELSATTSHPVSHDAHDDMVLACALAVSAAVRDIPELLPEKKEARLSGSNPDSWPFY